MLKEILGNIPLVEALEQMPDYAKFMKDLVTKKMTVSFELTDYLHHCSAIAKRLLVEKKEDSGAFTIPCTIGSFDFTRALCDLGASINLISLAIYKQLGLRAPKSTSMRLLMADRFIFPANLFILDCQVDFEVPIILGRPCLATSRALVDVEHGELIFRLNNKEVKFNVCSFMKQPKDMTVISVLDIEGVGSHSYAPKKLDVDLKNRPTLPNKPSIDEPLVIELK
ncbi:uncharacterized protein LOC129883528 [Solanum dulcamara]|uniref:uncharacterized protein LOC129883528 n=1 Tax=Solanum dulcamara TaxID=45834 RepID=UPI0024856AA4|nr:uncharacterized protein LOC129883528 [Solanum dulcamara]